jgi:NitT/TauT family transport system substrate-binding protein
VLEGDYQFAIGEYVSLLQARENDVPIQVVSNLTNGADEADQGINAVLTGADSGIAGPQDLAGRTVAVNGLGGVDDVTLMAILDENGVDPASVEFTEVPFPDMNAAVESGQVDAASQPEPFVTLGEQAGLVNLFDPYYEAIPSMPLGLVFGSEEWLADNPDLANAFHRALVRSIEASSDEQAMKDVIVENTEIDAELVEEIALDRWDAEVNQEGLQALADMSVEYGVLEEEPDLDALVWQPES